MTNPALHSWRLNWASLNPMSFLTQNRNKWGMAEFCMCASLTLTLLHRNPAPVLRKFLLSWKKWYDYLKFLRFNRYCMFLSVVWLLDSELLKFLFPRLLGNSIYTCQVALLQNPLIPQVTIPDHTLHHPAFMTSCKSSFLPLILLFRQAATYE